MRVAFYDRIPNTLDVAAADLIPLDDEGTTFLLTRVNVPESGRGCGRGSRLLKEVCAEADKHHATLLLEVIPSGPLDEAALCDWYSRNGFVPVTRPKDFVLDWWRKVVPSLHGRPEDSFAPFVLTMRRTPREDT